MRVRKVSFPTKPMKNRSRRILSPLILGIVVAASGLPTGCKKAEKEMIKSVEPRLRELDFSPFERSLTKLSLERISTISDLIRERDLLQVQEAMAAGNLSAEELTLFFLDRIRRNDETLRSYLEINPFALDEARSADQLRAEGRWKGPLHGIPVSVKDNIGTVAPMHTTAGAEILLDHSPPEDAVVVKRLREAGAVILGKVSLSELAGSLTTDPPGYNAISGMGVNPYGEGLPVSGSSSGSAIATSALLTMASVGTETSGSLISPASSNGVVAMKPSHGVVSGKGIVPLIRFQDSAGPVARSVMDAALLLSAIDESEVDFSAGLDTSALEGVAVGVLRAGILAEDDTGDALLWLERINEGLDLAEAVRRDLDETFVGKPRLLPVIFLGLSEDTIGYLVDAGAPVKTVADLQVYNLAEPAKRIPRGQNMIDLAVRILAAIGNETGFKEGVPDPLYKEAAFGVREGTSSLLARAFAENEVEALVSLANFHSDLYATAGFPAITVPLGLSEAGVPKGMTFIGRPGEDKKILAYAYAFEQATKYRIGPEIASK